MGLAIHPEPNSTFCRGLVQFGLVRAHRLRSRIIRAARARFSEKESDRLGGEGHWLERNGLIVCSSNTVRVLFAYRAY